MFPRRRTASRTLCRSRSVLTMVYRSSAAAPASQTQARIESQLCAGAAEPPAAAAELILNQEYGYMIAMKNQKITKEKPRDC